MHDQKTQTAYVYVVVRQDIPQPHRTVQASHAAIAATHAYGNPHATHPHLVVCTSPDEPTLDQEFNRLKAEGVPCCAWYEDDMDNQLTAIATGPLRGRQRRAMRGFPLLTG